jgi:hypothetical protein
MGKYNSDYSRNNLLTNKVNNEEPNQNFYTSIGIQCDF